MADNSQIEWTDATWRGRRELQEHVAAGGGEDPFPWFPVPERQRLRQRIAGLVQNRKAPLDGRTWDEYPEPRKNP